MGETTITCPRCFHTFPAGADVKFCPRCGLRDVARASLDNQPMDVTVRDRTFRVLDRIAVGAICMLYRCRFKDGSDAIEGLFKIARDAKTNDLVTNEATTLRQLHMASSAERFCAFLPKIVESFPFADGSAEPPRWANVLRMHAGINSPDELYTLSEVRSHYPNGLDARDVAWIWRRLLNVLGYIHAQDIVHAAVLPLHVLIEPNEHKLVLIDFCGAIRDASSNRNPLALINGGFDDWYRRAVALDTPPNTGLDVSFGARCMIELLAGDPIAVTFPPEVDPAIARHLERCANLDARAKADAWKLLEDFDRLIETLWGPRKFRVLSLPPKRT